MLSSTDSIMLQATGDLATYTWQGGVVDGEMFVAPIGA